MCPGSCPPERYKKILAYVPGHQEELLLLAGLGGSLALVLILVVVQPIPETISEVKVVLWILQKRITPKSNVISWGEKFWSSDTLSGSRDNDRVKIWKCQQPTNKQPKWVGVRDPYISIMEKKNRLAKFLTKHHLPALAIPPLLQVVQVVVVGWVPVTFKEELGMELKDGYISSHIYNI